MKNLWTQIRHNPGLVAGLFISLVSLAWVYGCESKVSSLKQPGFLVNRSELKLELDTMLSEFDLKVLDLDKQDALKQTIFALGVRFATGQGVDPAGMLLTLGNVLGIGLLADNLRKNTVVKVLKANINSLVALNHKNSKIVPKK